MKNGSLKWRIMNIGLMITGMIMCLLIVVLFYLRSSIEEDINEHNASMIHSISDQLETAVGIPLDMIGQVGGLIQKGYELNGIEIRDYLTTILSAHQYFTAIQIIDKSGALVNASPYDETQIGSSLIYKPYFRELPEGDYGWSEIFISTSTGKPTISVTMDEGDYLIVADLNLEYLPVKVADADQFSEVVEISLVDQYGTYIMTDDMTLVSQRANYPHFHTGKEQGVIVEGNLETQIHKVESMNWYIATVFDLDEVYGALNNLTIASLLISLLFSGFILYMISRYFKKVDKGINELQSRTHKIINSNYQVAPYDFEFREFIQLAEDFEIMNEEIRDREYRIRQFNEELEGKVSERTAQLQELNAQMEEEIQERTLAEEELRLVNENLDGLIQEKTKELSRSNRQLEENARQADEANEAKTRFLAIMSHEMRTPLNGIMGFLKMLDMKSMDESNRELVDIISHSSGVLLELVNDILDVSKYEARKGSFEELSMDFVTVLTDTLEPYRKMAHQQQLDFKVNMGDMPALNVNADPTKIAQIFTNLMSNALKFTKVGYIRVDIETKNLGDRYHITVTVEDTGIGIKEDVKPYLFKPFTQANDSITREFGGTGLGLTICKNIVNHYGGHIDYSGEYGVGTAFTFDLFLEKGTQSRIEVSGRARIRPTDRAESLLLVEDNEVNRKLMIKFLERIGKTCDIAVNGQEAVEMAKITAYDLIFMDCHMPVMDGLEATEIIRAFDPDVKIYAMTAYASKEDYDRCIDAGMNGFYTKPIEMEEIAELLGAENPFDNKVTDQSDEQNEEKMAYIRHLHMSLGFDMETCIDLIDTYIQQARELFGDILSLWELNNHTEIGHRLHQLKGASGAVRLEDIHKKVEKAEKLMKAGEIEESMVLVRKMMEDPLFA